MGGFSTAGGRGGGGGRKSIEPPGWTQAQKGQVMGPYRTNPDRTQELPWSGGGGGWLCCAGGGWLSQGPGKGGGGSKGSRGWKGGGTQFRPALERSSDLLSDFSKPAHAWQMSWSRDPSKCCCYQHTASLGRKIKAVAKCLELLHTTDG